MKYRDMSSTQKQIFWKGLGIYLLILTSLFVPYVIFYLGYGINYLNLILSDSDQLDFMVNDIGIEMTFIFLTLYHAGGLLVLMYPIQVITNFLGKKIVLHLYGEEAKAIM